MTAEQRIRRSNDSYVVKRCLYFKELGTNEEVSMMKEMLQIMWKLNR